MIWKNGHWRKGTLNKYLGNQEQTWIYEVIRIQNACPVFLSEHLDRLRHGAVSIDAPTLFTSHELTEGIFGLIAQTESSIGNIRIQVDQQSGSTMMGFITHHYPTYNDYQTGISLSLLQIERINPNIKYWNPDVRKSADNHIKMTGSYETILVNQEGYLTEGSRSNLFGIQNGKLITPPLKQVLPGITRQIVLKIAQEITLPIFESHIHKTELDKFESFFISGTSPGVLPVRKIDSNTFAANTPIIRQLSTLYQEASKQSIYQTLIKIRNIK